jgi:hypothetical protein
MGRIPVFFGLSFEVYLILLLIAIPTFYFWRWLYRKYIPDGRKRKFLIWLSTIILSPIIYVSIAFLFFFYLSYYPNRTFEKSRWDLYPDERYELTRDLIKSRLLIGKSRPEVRKLLGENAALLDSTNEWDFDLGYKPEIGNIDPSVLVVIFKNNHVVRVEQIR